MGTETGLDRLPGLGSTSLLDDKDFGDDAIASKPSDTFAKGGADGLGEFSIAQRESSRFEHFYGGSGRRGGYGAPEMPPYWPGEEILHRDETPDLGGEEARSEALGIAEEINLDPERKGKRIDVVIDLPENLPRHREAARDAIAYYQTYTNVDLHLVEGPIDPKRHDNELIVIDALDDWSGVVENGDSSPNAAMFSDDESNTGSLFVNPDQLERLEEEIAAGRDAKPGSGTAGILPEGAAEVLLFRTFVHEIGHRVNPEALFFHVSVVDRHSVMNAGQEPSHVLPGGHLVYSVEELAAINEYTIEGGYRDTHGPLRFPSDGKTLPPLWDNKKVVDGQIVDALPFGIDAVVDGDERFVLDEDVDLDLFEPSFDLIDPSVFTDAEGGDYELWSGVEEEKGDIGAGTDIPPIEPLDGNVFLDGIGDGGGGDHEFRIGSDDFAFGSDDFDTVPSELFVVDDIASADVEKSD